MTSGVSRYGMIWKLSPADDLNSSAARFWVPPTLMVPTLSLPGCARAALMKSCSVLNSESTLVAEHQLEIADGRDAGELLHRIERQRLVDRDADRGAVGDETDGIAVGRLRQHGARRRDAARSRLIFHDEALARACRRASRRQAAR